MTTKQRIILFIIIMALAIGFATYIIVDAHNNPPSTIGTVTVHARDGVTYGYYGDIRIINDGLNGEDINIILDGFLQGMHNTELEG